MEAALSKAASRTSRTMAVKTGASRCWSLAGAQQYRELAEPDTSETGSIFAPLGRSGDGRIGERGHDRLGCGVDGGPLALLAPETGPGRPQRLGHGGQLESQDHLFVSSSSSQRTTSVIEAPAVAAANSNGASSFSAFAYQKPASSIPPSPARAD